jgi:hypothetical protein
MKNSTINLPLAIFSLLVSTLLVISQARAVDYQQSEFQQVYQDYLQVSDGNGSARKVANAFDDLYQKDESDPLILVLLGSSHTMMGRDALMPWSKMRHTEKGLDEMALALRMLQPQNKTQLFQHMSVDLNVKTIAAISFTQVPGFFGRQEEGYEIFQQVLADPVFVALPGPAKTYVYYYAIEAAVALDNTDQAKQWLSDLRTLNISDEYTQAALQLEPEL